MYSLVAGLETYHAHASFGYLNKYFYALQVVRQEYSQIT